MPECEKCGRRARNLNPVKIEGAEMFVCVDCTKYGVKVVIQKEPISSVPRSGVSHQPGTYQKKDALDAPIMVLTEDYPKRIQRAREGQGLSREGLGRKINEKVSVISKLENGDMHPSDALIKKLEKALEIRLKERMEEAAATHSMGSGGMTLADFIVRKGE